MQLAGTMREAARYPVAGSDGSGAIPKIAQEMRWETSSTERSVRPEQQEGYRHG